MSVETARAIAEEFDWDMADVERLAGALREALALTELIDDAKSRRVIRHLIERSGPAVLCQAYLRAG